MLCRVARRADRAFVRTIFTATNFRTVVCAIVVGLQRILRVLSGRAYAGDTFIARWRRARVRAFEDLVKPPPQARIIDLGGTFHMWNLINHDYHVTLVNLPGSYTDEQWRACPPQYELVEADACDLTDMFADQSFDVVFSNSVIEHVGDESRQEAFAREVQRLAPAYWVQTPSDAFPIEAHTGVPFYWKLPEGVRLTLERRWYEKLPAWAESIRETRVLSRQRMEELFPGASVYIERKLLFEKSYACYRPS
jgi:hypothetical protein